jgi:uncharacterized membrane protein (DUF4010 family)
MTQDEILARLGLALAIGLLIGLERGWKSRALAEGARTAGLRTFALVGLSGGIWAALSAPLGPAPLAAGFLAVAGAVTLFRWREAQRDQEVGVTTVVAAMLTFALGAYAVLGDMTVAAAAAVATAALLAAKGVLHSWVEAMTWEELRATLVLLAMSFVALPLLPDRDVGPYGAINLHNLWLTAIVIAGVSYVGYAAVKLVGDRYGTLVAGLAGGLVSSTAATLDAARKARAAESLGGLQLQAALAASGVMFLRVLVVATLFGGALAERLAPPLLTAAGVCLAVAGARFAMAANTAGERAARFANPFEFLAVLRFAALLAAIIALSKWLTAVYGGGGATALAAAAGLADVDAPTLSTIHLASSGGLTAAEATLAVLVATASNTAAKSAIALWVGGARFGAAYLAVQAAAVAAGAAAAGLFGSFA